MMPLLKLRQVLYVLVSYHYFLSPFPVYVICVCFQFQESPMPDPSELFTNVFVKGLGTEVDLILHPFFFLFFTAIWHRLF